MFASQMPADFQVWKSVVHICVMKSVGHKSVKMGIWWIWTPPEPVIYAVLQIPWAEENMPLGIRVGWYFLKWSSSHVWVLLEPCRSHLLAIHLEKSSIGKQWPTFVSWDPRGFHETWITFGGSEPPLPLNWWNMPLVLKGWGFLFVIQQKIIYETNGITIILSFSNKPHDSRKWYLLETIFWMDLIWY